MVGEYPQTVPTLLVWVFWEVKIVGHSNIIRVLVAL